jgi:hypothetical protein
MTLIVIDTRGTGAAVAIIAAEHPPMRLAIFMICAPPCQHYIRKLVSVCRQQDRYLRSHRQEKERTTIDEEYVKQWRPIRKEAGPRIDQEVAHVASWHAYTIDPYGVCSDIPEEAQTVGREWFARSPRSDVWVLFDDLPGATQDALSEPTGRRGRRPPG